MFKHRASEWQCLGCQTCVHVGLHTIIPVVHMAGCLSKMYEVYEVYDTRYTGQR